MEHNDIDSSSNRNQTTETPFFDRKPGLQIAIIIGVIVLGFLYVKFWSPRQECANQISYHPATQSVSTSDSRWGSIQGKGEYYSYRMKEFKTKSEAISYCVQDKK